ncbi:PAS domain S-box protein [Sediminibacterium goheungense]|uniref:histidine kinase n=1 Tax=Sediminibacterium goheungense TaxID=1086393 RepID=A0A4R6J1C1_9BACT|nr:PAS domain S-box protein [Sediminibacterium goheungense]TDO29042.1 PAS domain S-box-containing protein [Sediminibacterium goheungense]
MSDSQHALSILVVEDNPGDLFLLEELLKTTSLPIHRLIKVVSATEAKQALQKEEINLVLLDLSLPDSNGLQSYESVNEYAASIPIIVLTGLIDMEIALETMASGAQDYLIKGEFDEKLLAKSIQYSIERKKSLENLTESNERYKFVTRATNDVVWDMNISSQRILWAGENLKRLFGYELPDDESDLGFWSEKIHPEERDGVVKRLLNTCAGNSGELWSDEYRFQRANGTSAYVLDKGYLLYKNGKPVRMIGSMQDITERKLAELQVQNSEKRFRSLVQNGSDMIKILDENAIFTFSSPSVEQVLGYTSEQIIGKSVFDFIHPDELNQIGRHFDFIQNSDYHEIQYFRFKNAKGEWRWLETKLTNLLNDPAVKGIVSNSRDVTEKKKAEEAIKESEERYRNLFFNNPMSIYIWDIETYEILEVNDTAQREYGYTREDFLRLKTLDLREGEEEVAQYKLFVNNLKNDSSENVHQIIWKHKKSNGDALFMEVYSQKLYFKEKKAVIALANNVTEKIKLEKKLEEERNARQKEITEAVIRVQEKERYEISRELHDNVNQQLTVAMMYIATIEKGTGNAEALLKQSSGFIYNAIEEIRKLSKALVTPLIKDFGLCKAIDGLLEDIHMANTIQLDFFYDNFHEEDISYEFKLNIFRIVQEQMNNIVKHAQAKQVVIELYREEKIRLSIIDDGKGFDTEQKRSGIGLNNIQTRTELYAGKLNIQSSPGHGCKVKIEYPITNDILIVK